MLFHSFESVRRADDRTRGGRNHKSYNYRVAMWWSMKTPLAKVLNRKKPQFGPAIQDGSGIECLQAGNRFVETEPIDP